MSDSKWKSSVGLALAAAGGAVGLGNFLRFPGVAYLNGGGAFIVPYLICFFCIAIPLCLVEWSLGRGGGDQGKHSSSGVISTYVKNPLVQAVAGSLGTIIPLGVYFYYALIQAWCLGYLLVFLGLSPYEIPKTSQESIQLFQEISKSSTNSFEFSFPLICILLVSFTNAWVILKGIQKGVERFCKWAVPLMIALALVILIRVLTLGTVDGRSVDEALGFMWNPKGVSGQWTEFLSSPSVWLAAFGQVFFSLSVGFGILITYASYVPKNKDVALTALTASSTNGFVEVCLGGLITIPAIYLFLGPNFDATSSFSLGFLSLPLVFEKMWGLNWLFGCLWFLMLFLAAITSAISMIFPFLAFLQDYFSLSFKKAAFIALAIMISGNLLCYKWSFENRLLDSLDFWIGTVAISLNALVLCVIGAILRSDYLYELLSSSSAICIPKGITGFIKYVSLPMFLVVILMWLNSGVLPKIQETFNSIEQLMGFMAALSMFLVSAAIIYFKSR